MIDKLNGWIFFIKVDELLKMDNGIWNCVSNSIRKELDRESICNKKISENNIRSYGHEATNFHDNENLK